MVEGFDANAGEAGEFGLGEAEPATVRSSSADKFQAASLGGESIIWRAGVRYHVNKNFDVFSSLSYDNDDVTEFRTGFAWRF